MKTRILLSAALLLAGAAQGTVITYTTLLDGPSESPPNASPGSGVAEVTVDTDLHTMQVQLLFTDLLGTTTASHIHAPTAVAGDGTAGVATRTPTFLDFPLGVTSGVYDKTYDMTLASSYNPSFVTLNGSVGSSEAALFSALAAGKAYLNIHTTFRPGGEIRGFLLPVATVVPEASTYGAGLLALGLVGWATYHRRRASSASVSAQ